VANVVAGTNGLGILTEREFEVFRLIAAGRTLPEISEILFLNYKTIANYQSSIRQKLGAENAVQLLQIAMAHGMVERKG
jgi:DNA-binding CsgD family transcriptional regulator